MSGSAPIVYVPQGTPRRVKPSKLVGSTGCVFLVIGLAFGGFGWPMFFGMLLSMKPKEKVVALFPLLFAAIGTAFLVTGLRGILFRRRLYVWGDLALGSVTAVKATGTRINDRPLLAITYTFQGPTGPMEGTMKNLEAPPVGSEVSVLYDRNDPGKSVLPTPGSFD